MIDNNKVKINIKKNTRIRHGELEHRAFQLIITSGEEGLLQSELWRTLNATSREGSRISIKLEKKGLISSFTSYER